jgi:hypothetical protein
MSSVDGLNPPVPYTGTDPIQVEINLLETYVDQLLSEVMAGGALAGASPFVPGDSIGSSGLLSTASNLPGGLPGEILAMVQMLLQQIATLETEDGSSQAPWSPFSSQAPLPQKQVKVVTGGSSQPAAGPSQAPAPGPSQVPVGSDAVAPGTFTSQSTYSGPGDTVAGGTLKPQDIDRLYGGTISADVAKYNKEYGTNLTVAYVEAIVYQESKGDPLAAADQGSEGLMQVTSLNAPFFSPGNNQFDPAVSLDSGIHMLAIMDQSGTITDPALGTFQGAGGNLDQLSIMYNRGPRATEDPLDYHGEIDKWMAMYLAGTPPPETY